MNVKKQILAIAVITASSLSCPVIAQSAEVKVVELKPGTVASNPRIKLYDTIANALDVTGNAVETRTELLSKLETIYHDCVAMQDRACIADVFSQTLALNDASINALKTAKASYSSAEEQIAKMLDDITAVISNGRSDLLVRFQDMSLRAGQLKEVQALAANKEFEAGEEYQVAAIEDSFRTELELLALDAEAFSRSIDDRKRLASQLSYINTMKEKTKFEVVVLSNEQLLVAKSLEMLIAQAVTTPLEELVSAGIPTVSSARESIGYKMVDVLIEGDSSAALPEMISPTRVDFDPTTILKRVENVIASTGEL
jgi:hypothetical protein